MRYLLIFIFASVSFSAFGGQSHYADKITDIIEYGDYFNGSWRDSWGKTVVVKNAVYFPARCQMSFAGSKKSQIHEYLIQAQIDFAEHPIVRIEKSSLSSSVKIVFEKALVNSISVNRRTGERKKNKEKVASFYYRPSDGRDLYKGLVDTLKSYREFCTQ